MNKKIKRKRPIEKKVRFDLDEWEFVLKRIQRSPFKNFQNFARILLITGEIKFVDYSHLKKLNSEVNRIGNNINQMAKLAHQFDEISEEDVQNLTQVLKEMQRTIKKHLEEEYKQERTI